MKRITKYQKAEKVATRLMGVRLSIKTLGEKTLLKALFRRAFLKGYKSGMARRARIASKRERVIQAMAEHKRIADLMG